MSLLEDLNGTLDTLDIPIETGVFQDMPPEEYLVITPLSDSFGFHADDLPQYEVQEARLSFFKKGSYTRQKNRIVRALLAAGFSITDRRYIGHEDDTGYHHYAIDVAKHYEMEV